MLANWWKSAESTKSKQILVTVISTVLVKLGSHLDHNPEGHISEMDLQVSLWI